MNDDLWERLAKPAPEPRTGLSLGRIARGAVEVADEGGLDAVSMARVAERLGFTTMSLYRHVKSKNELLLLMLDSVAAVPAELDEPCAGWRDGLRRWCRAQWEMLRAHTWIVRLPVTGPPVTPNQLAWTDRALATLAGTGLGERDKAGVVLLVATYMHATARLNADLGTAASGTSIAAHNALLGSLVDARHLPALRRAVDAGAFDYPPDTPEDERRLDYEFGLARILDGVEALIRAA
ncbi:TetR/AcrR family transcriptional regulator C-terminal domain-containing protein [Nonomuraea sp. K274]|uniref:TetR/AcrR family transcriptional regulator C-terminal domain-containing protein n=1 Tax=Nonomuraea cypriaca TaxID=1187855 RepID=A0A931EZY7_9ACTN|nr:TetR/AcrR family transcriptional regulator [Nonomuraea cypriaca]MBF8190324.1 TetR/AcrR family transcriptional regulator C-terminal domain-containing protein [Nonomuraea cypriaca]